MAYEVPKIERYGMPSAAFGATADSRRVIGPPGKKGLVRDIQSDLTADAVGTTTVPEIVIGTAAGDATYGRFRLGSTAIAGYTAAGGPYRASQVANNAQGRTGGSPPASNDYAGHVALESAYIPADTPFYISRKAGVGGTPAGTGTAEVEIHWF